MSQKGFAPILIVLLIAVVAGIGGYFIYTNYSNNRTQTIPPPTTQPTPVAPAISWDVPPGTIPQAEERQLKEALNAFDVSRVVSKSSYVDVVNARVSGDWAALFGGERSKTPQAFNTTGKVLILAHKSHQVGRSPL